MKKTKFFRVLLAAALVAVSLAGCGNSAEKTSDDALPTQEEGGKQTPQNERGIMAKVVSLSGKQLTVILADMPARGDGNRTPPTMGVQPGSDTGSADGNLQPDGAAQSDGNTLPDGAAPPDGVAPSNGGPGPVPPSGAAIDGPDAAAGNPAPNEGNGPVRSGELGDGGGKLEFTGENVTYSLSGDLVIMKGTGNSAVEIDLSELRADDVIRFTTTGDDGNKIIESIAVME